MAHVPTTIAMYTAKALAVPFSFTGHAADIFRDYALLPAKLRRAKFICCISHWHREYYKSVNHSLSNARLPIVRCGVDTSVFHVKNEVDETSSEQHCFRIFSVGRLVEKKGFDTLLRACGLMARAGKVFECTIIGDGPEAAGLAKLVKKENLSSVVQMPGAKSNHEIRKTLSESDLFVLPCRAARSGDKDGIPVVLMEAMACGIPVVSGDLVTIRELIQHEQNGMMVQPENAKELAKTLTQLMDNPTLRNRLSKAGRQQIESEFSLTLNVNRLLEAINSILKSHEHTLSRTTTLCPENTVS
jgi:glycosyltransferase involved in cell wall biosynthesis